MGSAIRAGRKDEVDAETGPAWDGSRGDRAIERGARGELMRDRVLAALPAVLGACIFGVAILVLQHELAAYRLSDIETHLASISARHGALALVLTIASYALLTGYDALAFRFLGSALAYPRVALASFVGFVFSHNIGLSFLGGNAVRYRILTSFDVAPGDIARVVAFNLITFWLGFFALGGVVLTLDPIALPATLHLPFATSRPIGALLLVALAAYMPFSLLRRSPLRVGGFEFAVPRLRWTIAQLALSALDWALAAAIFFVLLPHKDGLSFAIVLGAYLLAQVIGLASHVPGGLGVFEGVMVLLLRQVPLGPGRARRRDRLSDSLLPAAAVVAVVVFGGYEALQRRQLFERGRRICSRAGCPRWCRAPSRRWCCSRASCCSRRARRPQRPDAFPCWSAGSRCR